MFGLLYFMKQFNLNKQTHLTYERFPSAITGNLVIEAQAVGGKGVV